MTNGGAGTRDQTSSGLDARDQEMIAAFIDRRLSAEDRRAFMARIAEDEALYEVFVETVRFRDQQAGGPATVVEHPASRRRWGRPAAIAALLAVAVATPLLLRGLAEERYAESLVADGRLDPAPGGQWHEQGWPVSRGISSSLGGADAAFRAGVQGMDLEIALRLGRDEDTGNLTHKLEATLGSLEFSQVLQVYYSELRERLEGGAPDAELLALAESAASGFANQFPELARAYRLGRWAEAGKLAARSGNRELLTSRSFRRDLERLRQADADWDPEVAARLEAIDSRLAAPAGRLDLAALEASFAAIIAES